MREQKEKLENILKSDNPILFLDRDGVINRKIDSDYVRSWKDFEFIEGVMSALKFLSRFFKRIIIVTNQRGIGRGLMSESELNKIHSNMLKEFKENSIKIDKIYYCGCDPERDVNCNCRKPSPTMALRAKKDFPEIEFEKSIMVGDSKEDIEFGKRLGMLTVFLGDDTDIKADFKFNCLKDFADFLEKVFGNW